MFGYQGELRNFCILVALKEDITGCHWISKYCRCSLWVLVLDLLIANSIYGVLIRMLVLMGLPSQFQMTTFNLTLHVQIWFAETYCWSKYNQEEF